MQRTPVEVADVDESPAGWYVAAQAPFGLGFVLAGIFVADDAVLRVSWPLIGFCWIALAYRQWRNRVCFDAQGLVAGGRWLARRILAWSDVDKFEVRNGPRELGVWSTDGEWVHLATFAKDRVDVAHAVARRLQRARPEADIPLTPAHTVCGKSARSGTSGMRS